MLPASTTAAIRTAATPGEPHNPDQPARSIPKIGLTIKALMAAVKLATRYLNGATPSSQPVP